MTAVLDSSAVVAVALGEAGAEIVLSVLSDSVIGAVNLAEVVDVLSRQRLDKTRIQRTIDSLHLDVIPFDEMLARRTGDLAQETRHLGLSLGDRACIALAERWGGEVVTADRRWKDASLSVRLTLIR